MYIPHSVTDRRTDRQTQCSYYCTSAEPTAVKNRLRMSVTAKINPSTTHTAETTALRSFDTSTVWLMEYYYKTQCIHGRKNTQDFFIFIYLFIYILWIFIHVVWNKLTDDSHVAVVAKQYSFWVFSECFHNCRPIRPAFTQLVRRRVI